MPALRDFPYQAYAAVSSPGTFRNRNNMADILFDSCFDKICLVKVDLVCGKQEVDRKTKPTTKLKPLLTTETSRKRGSNRH